MGAFSVSGTFILPSGHTATGEWQCEPRHMFAQAITRFMIVVLVDPITVHRKNQDSLVEDRPDTQQSRMAVRNCERPWSWRSGAFVVFV